MKNYINKARATSEIVSKWTPYTFEWGKFDCAQMVADLCVKAGHKDPLEGFAHYKSIQQARKSLRAAGFKKYTDAIDAIFQPINESQLMIGDLVGLKSPERGMDAIGIRVGASEPHIFAFFPQWDLEGNPIEAPSKPSSIPFDELKAKGLLSNKFWRLS